MLDFLIRTLGIICGIMMVSYLFNFEIKSTSAPKEESIQELKLKQKDLEAKILSLERKAQVNDNK